MTREEFIKLQIGACEEREAMCDMLMLAHESHKLDGGKRHQEIVFPVLSLLFSGLNDLAREEANYWKSQL